MHVIYRASMASYQAVCYEYAVEMTYPLPESVSSSLMNIMSQVNDTHCFMHDKVYVLL